MAILYEHWRPDLNECFYVGITQRSETGRPRDMKNRCKGHRQVVAELAHKGLEPEIRLQVNDISWKDAKTLEKLQIAYWRELIEGRLTNVADGGQGSCGYKHTEDARRRISESRIGDKNPVHTRTPEARSESANLATETKRRRGTLRCGDNHPTKTMDKDYLREIGFKAARTCRENGNVMFGAKNPMTWPDVKAKKSATAQRNGKVRGTRNPKSKLTEADVLDIRNSDLKPKLLAEIYGVTTETIWSVRARKTWIHIKGTEDA